VFVGGSCRIDTVFVTVLASARGLARFDNCQNVEMNGLEKRVRLLCTDGSRLECQSEPLLLRIAEAWL
jgi:hypothetical protein